MLTLYDPLMLKEATQTNILVLPKIILGAEVDSGVTWKHQELDLLTSKQCRQLHMAMECFNKINSQESGLHSFFILAANARERPT